MSVWFKYPSDKDITTGHPSGSSVFAPTTIGGGGGFPAYGTVLYTEYSATYQIGAEQYSSVLATFVDTQNCDVLVLADGIGGSFYDWSSATNIQYKPYGEYIGTDTNLWETNPVEIPSGSYNFVNSGYYDAGRNEVHDGMGNLTFVGVGAFTYYPAGSSTGVGNPVANTIDVPSYSGNYYDTGTGYDYPYLWDGIGGFYRSATGNFYGSYYSNGTEVDTNIRYHSTDLQTEVPSGSSYYVLNGKYNLDSYYWDGSGNYYTAFTGDTGGVYYNYGDYILNDGTYDYYWDGAGGYYYI